MRFGGNIPKQFQLIGDKPILAHTMAAFNNVDIVNKIIVTTPANYINHAWEIATAHNFSKVRAVIAGGSSRAASIYAALKALPFVDTGEALPGGTHSASDIVLIHDGVRPFASEALIRAVSDAAGKHGAAITGTPLTDTIKEVDSKSRVTSTPDRSRYWRVQTPQGFTYDTIMKAYAKAEKDGNLDQATDDSMLIERLGITVHMVTGETNNIKITTREDLAMCEVLLQHTRKS